MGSVGSIGFVCSAGEPSMSVKLSKSVNHGPSMLASLRGSAIKRSVAYFLFSFNYDQKRLLVKSYDRMLLAG